MGLPFFQDVRDNDGCPSCSSSIHPPLSQTDLPMTTLHLIRHGQTDWNAIRRVQGTSESTLTPLGETQAATVRERWGGKQFDRVFSSDLQRTRQTTHILLDGQTDQVDYRSTLREIHLGPWEGVMLDDAIRDFPEQADFFRNRPSQFSLDGAETFHQLQNRARQAVEQIVDECSGQEVLIVSHGAFIKSLMLAYANRSLDKMWHPPELQNCGHSIVVFEDGEPQIKLFADQTDW